MGGGSFVLEIQTEGGFLYNHFMCGCVFVCSDPYIVIHYM